MIQNSALIAAEDVYGLLNVNDPFIRLIDASYLLPGADGPDPKSVFEEKRIGNAQFFDIDDIADPHTNLPHMLPRPDLFAQKVGAMGISNESHVVIYGQENVLAGPARAWWMFRVFGHQKVSVMNCSLREWENKIFPVMRDPVSQPQPAQFNPEMNNSLVVSFDAIEALSSSQIVPVYDARPQERFRGETPEPREGIRSGHIAGSINVPASSLIHTDTGGLKHPQEYQHMFTRAMMAPQKNPVVMCGSGLTACLLALALFELDVPKGRVYDGSWTEWAQKMPAA